MVLVIGLVITSLLATYSAEQETARGTAGAAQRAEQIGERLSTTLTPMDSVTQAIHAYLVASPDLPDTDELTAFMQRLYLRWNTFRSIVAAPDNTVTVVVPEDGNEAVIGLHYPEVPDQWTDVLRAMQTRTSVLSGPLDLAQGGRGLLYRTPVFLADGSYWGVVTAVIDEGALLHAEESDVVILDRAANDARVVGSTDVLASDPARASMSLFGRSFDVAVAPPPADRTAAMIITLGGTIASVLLAVLVFLLTGAITRERALARLMGDLSAQAPGVLFQLRQHRDGDMEMTYASHGVERLLALGDHDSASTADEFVALEDLVHPEDRAATARARLESARTGQPWHQRYRVRFADGTVRWLLTDAQPQQQSNGDIVWHGWVGDVTEDVAEEEALRVSASLFEVTRDGVIVLDADGRTDSVNAGFTAMTGFTRDDVAGRPFTDYVRGNLADEVVAEFWAQLREHGYWRGEITGRDANGHVRTDTATATAVRSEDGRLSHYLVVLDNMDITRDDAITGLPSPRMLEEAVRQAVERSDTAGEHAAVVALGLDQFRQVNDSYGHRVGDEALRAIAHRLRATVPTGSVLVRMRGDEFAILLPDVRDVADVERVARACLSAVSVPVEIGRHVLRMTAAVGVSVYPDDDAVGTELPIHATQAMRAAKALGPNQICYFTAEMQAAARSRVAMVDDLGAALRRANAHLGSGSDELEIVLQPVVNPVTGEVHRAEALTRWMHPQLGPIRPDVFIPLAEQAGLVADLGDFVFAEVVRALVVLRDVDPVFQVAVNLSPLELQGPVERHARRLASLSRAGLTGDSVIAEITEGALLAKDPTVESNIATYRGAGLRFAIDDFGTGYSSLAYLMELDVQILKIDRSFVDAVAPGSDGLALCQAIIAMGQTMGIQVIAEGVETEQQERLLAAAGCDFIQGFLHSPPLPLADLLVWLSERASAAGTAAAVPAD